MSVIVGNYVEEEPKPCSICLKPGKALHFSVFSCCACKTFFYREVEKGPLFACERDGKCYDATSEAGIKKCRTCRFNKCLAVGMKTASSFDELFKTIIDKKSDAGALLNKLIAIDDDREQQLMKHYSLMDPNLEEVLRNPKCARLRNITEDTVITAHEWAFLDVFSRITGFLQFRFIRELDFQDKKILFTFNAMRSLLLGGAMRMKEAGRDTLTTPMGGPVYPEVVYKIFPEDLLKKVCCKPVGRLIELRISKEEYYILMMILVCNPTIDGLSEETRNILSQYRLNFCQVLVQMCQLKHQNNFSYRMVELLSMIDVINNADQNLQNISLLFQRAAPDFKFSRLVQDTFVRIGNTNRIPIESRDSLPQKRRTSWSFSSDDSDY